jgi:hypothetical protein
MYTAARELSLKQRLILDTENPTGYEKNFKCNAAKHVNNQACRPTTTIGDHRHLRQ